MLSSRPVRRLAVAVAALALLGACGGDDGDEGANVSDSSPAAPGTDSSSGSSAGPQTTVTDSSTETSGAPATSAAAGTIASTGSSGATADIEAYVEEGAAEIGTDDEEAATCFSRAVIDGIGAERCCEVPLSDRHANAVGEALAKRPGRCLHARRNEVLRMAGGFRMQLTKSL